MMSLQMKDHKERKGTNPQLDCKNRATSATLYNTHKCVYIYIYIYIYIHIYIHKHIYIYNMIFKNQFYILNHGITKSLYYYLLTLRKITHSVQEKLYFWYVNSVCCLISNIAHFIFYWCIVVLQCCLSFYCTVTWSSLCHTACSHLLSILYILVYTCQSQSLNSSQSPFPPWCPYVCSLHLCLYFCLANKFICTIFLDSTYMF